MAHIYLRNTAGWRTLPESADLIELAEVMRLFYQVENIEEAQNVLGLGWVEYLKLKTNQASRLGQSIDQILIRDGTQYKIFKKIFKGYSPSGVLLPFETISASSLPAGKYVNGTFRVTEMNHEERSGDLVLIMKSDSADASQRFRQVFPVRPGMGV